MKNPMTDKVPTNMTFKDDFVTWLSAINHVLTVQFPQGELIGDNDIVHTNNFDVAIPAGVGVFKAVSMCGQWNGEMRIEPLGSDRVMTYLAMTQIREQAADLATIVKGGE
jgi:hypothetical protein